jgi:hypothetical protein
MKFECEDLPDFGLVLVPPSSPDYETRLAEAATSLAYSSWMESLPYPDRNRFAGAADETSSRPGKTMQGHAYQIKQNRHSMSDERMIDWLASRADVANTEFPKALLPR